MSLFNIKDKLAEFSGVTLSIISIIMGLMGLYYAHNRDFAWVIPLFIGWLLIKLFSDRVPTHFFKTKETNLQFIIETINEISTIGIILPFVVFIYLDGMTFTPLSFSCIFFTLCTVYREVNLLVKQLRKRTELVMEKYFLGCTCPINSGFYIAPLFFEPYGVPTYFQLENLVTFLLIFSGLFAILPIPTYSLFVFRLNRFTSIFLFPWIIAVFILSFINPAYAWILFIVVFLSSVPFSIFNYWLDLKRSKATKREKS